MEFSGRAKKFIQYLWDPEPSNDPIDPADIWLLGFQYSKDSVSITVAHSQDDQKSLVSDRSKNALPQTNETSLSAGTDSRGWPLNFVHDFASLYAFTYRTNFPPIHRSIGPSLQRENTSLGMQIRLSLATNNEVFTSDTGWGCMIRSGQSLIANAIARLWTALGKTKAEDNARLISMFIDDSRAPFSIHNFVVLGAEQCGKAIGEWFGPSATAQCIRSICAKYLGNELKVLVTEDGPNVYEDSFLRLAEESSGNFCPVLILCGARLGIDGITKTYYESFKRCFKMPQSVGVAGGRPSASHYFVGLQGEHVFYLDPHDTRQAIPWQDDAVAYESQALETYHTKRLRRVSIRELDPSMLIGFLIQSREDWDAWKDSINRLPSGRPIIHIADQEPQPSLADQTASLGVESCDDDDDNDDGTAR